MKELSLKHKIRKYDTRVKKKQLNSIYTFVHRKCFSFYKFVLRSYAAGEKTQTCRLCLWALLRFPCCLETKSRFLNSCTCFDIKILTLTPVVSVWTPNTTFRISTCFWKSSNVFSSDTHALKQAFISACVILYLSHTSLPFIKKIHMLLPLYNVTDVDSNITMYVKHFHFHFISTIC